MMFRPHDYQRYCIDRILGAEKLGLFLDMGLGKTVITLTAIQELIYNRFAVSRVLIIAPKKVAEATWSTEAAKWEHLQHLRFSLILGSEQKRIRAIYAPADVYVINRENVVWLVDYLRNNWCFDMVVIDESSSFKNHRAKRFKSLTWIQPHVKRLIELTGTPAPNSLADLWAQLYLLDEGKRLGRNITAFRDSFFRANTHGGHFTTYEETEGAAQEIQSRISDICISMKSEDYLQLPELVYDVVPVKLDDRAQNAYNEMEREMLLEIDEAVIDAGSAAALSNKLLQLCNGAVYTEEGNWVALHNCKIEAFMELIERLNGQPALVFYNFKHDRERLVTALTKAKKRVRLLQTPEDADAWNRRELDVLLAHPASCAYGLNLQQGGNHVIWFGLNWSLELFLQANKRLHRQGQTSAVIVHELAVQNSRDMDVIAALQDKDATQDALIESLKVRIRQVKNGGKK
ncbi:MAG: DEAD/DEAH box helicase [Lachnospiraceae bacterium]|nr:DEAD/DEAH box helicase [Lachnospiraceae bacterium]